MTGFDASREFDVSLAIISLYSVTSERLDYFLENHSKKAFLSRFVHYCKFYFEKEIVQRKHYC